MKTDRGPRQADLYQPHFVQSTFQEMAATYGVVNLISSFGFARRWREQCVAFAPIRPGMIVYDLMCGTGECWHIINRRLCNQGRVLGLDFSSAMCERAKQTRKHIPSLRFDICEQDFLENSLPSNSADAIVSAFGLKTFSDQQLRKAADEMFRILKPGGWISLLEISVPSAWLLRIPFMWYVKRAVPVIGRLFAGNPECYRLLGVYTEAFRSCEDFGHLLRQRGLAVRFRRLFLGCATALYGKKDMVGCTYENGSDQEDGES